MTALLRLYPGSWRTRYGDEMEALLEARRPGLRERVDLVRGAADAWLHPATRSRVPAAAALIGGGLWTITAAAVNTQPTPSDWPGYIAEVLGFALVAAVFLLIAAVGCFLRANGRGRRPGTIAIWLTVAGHVAWIAALAATASGVLESPVLAAAQTLAMLGAALVGVVLVRVGDLAVGFLILVGSAAMLLPWTLTWLVLGAAWNGVGWLLVIERSKRPGAGWRVS
jgi:hypothetical protein